jgi:hypothetical protein
MIAAGAAPAFADNAKTADEKFEAASKLRDAGKGKEACAMFAESLALNPNAIGTILNVARCAEEDNKVATAIRYFTDARDRSREQNLAPQLSAAEEHLTKLTPRQSHLVITFSEKYPADAKLVVGGRVVDFTTASDIAVDAGAVEVVVSSPDRVPYTTTAQVPEAQHLALTIPILGYPVTVCASCGTVGKVSVAVGSAAVVGSVIVGWVSHRHWETATAACAKLPSGDLACGQDSVDKVNDARTLGNTSTVIGITGSVLLLGGAALWYFAPSRTGTEHMAFVPVVTPTEAGLAAITRF